MSWSTQFQNALGSVSCTVEYKLEFVRAGFSVGKLLVVTSGGNGNLKIARGSVQIQGTRIIPQRWNVSFGQFSLSLVGNIRTLTERVRKGQLAILKCRIVGQSTFQKIAVGSLRSLTGHRKVYQLEFNDLMTALSNSFDARAGKMGSALDPPRFRLFSRAGLTTTVRTAFTAGDTTLDVVTDEIFKRPTSPVGARGLIKCTASASGNSFFMFFTGTASNQILGLSSSVYPAGSVENLQVGDTVTALVWLEGAPYDIFGSIIMSSGFGTNGPLDRYPEEWGIGLGVNNSLWDDEDASNQSRVIKRSDGGSYEWGFYIDTPPTNGIRFLTDLAAGLGQWPVLRMGKLSWRACTDPTGANTLEPIYLAAEITDKDIFSIVRHEFFNRDVPTIFRSATLIYTQSGARHQTGSLYDDRTVRTLPAQDNITRNGTFLYLADQGGSDFRTEASTMDLFRMRGWDVLESEKIVLRVNLKFAFLVAGDIVSLTSKSLSGAFDPIGYRFNRRRMMVAGCDFNIDEQNCTLTLVMISRRIFDD